MRKIVFFILISMMLYGCTPDHLVYGHDTSLGIDVAVSTEGTGRIVLGYDRDTFAIVPRKGPELDAMTLTSVGCVYVDGLNEISFNHFVSTGQAAITIAKDQKGLKVIEDALYGGLKKCEQ